MNNIWEGQDFSGMLSQPLESESTHLSLSTPTVVDGGEFSRREWYQEVILQLFELEEELLQKLPSDELYGRQQVLIQLLRATSEEEAYMTSLSLDDVSEIIAHVQLCIEFGSPVQWSMLESIVFPMGLPTDNSSVHTPRDVVLSTAAQDECCSKDPSNRDITNLDSFHDYVELTEAELEIVLNHINLCHEVGQEIRWDLLAEILFPCDTVRKELLANKTTVMDRKPPNLESVDESDFKVVKERARAVLSLSNHDWNVASLHNWDLSDDHDSDVDIHEGSNGSFFEDSAASSIHSSS
jgi:hypothetical protein